MEDSNTSGIVIDETYEFSAPRYYDFVVGETEDDVRNAEVWFDTALAHAPSPFMMRIKSGRSVQLSSQCEFGDAEHAIQASESDNPTSTPSKATEVSKLEAHTEIKENWNPNKNNREAPDVLADQEPVGNKKYEALCDKINEQDDRSTVRGPELIKVSNVGEPITADVCTPKPAILVGKGVPATADSKRQQTLKKIASTLKNPSALKSKIQSHTKAVKPVGTRRDASNMKSSVGTPNFVQENQAIKRQKLDDGKTRQILNIKPPSLPHKNRPGTTTNSSKQSTSTAKPSKENRKIYVRAPAAPYISMAEMMKKFQSSTRDMSLPQNSTSQAKLELTRPKEPEFVTSQRVRLAKIKSSAELEEEMMANMPKFKARPLNKKILEAPTLPPLPKSQTPKPEFQEFHLETMERASKNAEVSSVVSTESGHQRSQWKPHHLTEPKTPLLQTSLRTRPINVKSSLEIEQEELEKIPKFKARPLNKKIFESKGELGLFCNDKKQVTVPKEFHFAIDERIPPPSTAADLFDKLSLNSEPNKEKKLPRLTRPNPFNLYTEERGAEKERRLVYELVHKQMEDERARVPKATPYPYTTDYPVLESLIRHEEEMRREMEEMCRMEREEADKRIFKAQPVLKEDPIPLPEKERKPLTEVQEFNLHVEHRAVDRAEFDKKIKEKEMMYKRYREEAEAEKQMEEEKALKQLRRTLVPHARPVPSFANPFIPQNRSCKEPTKAKSPKLRVHIRKERKASQRTNLQAAYSAAAALMR